MNNKIIAYNSIDYVFGTHFWSLDSAGVGSCSKGGWEQDRGVGVNSVFIPSLGHRTDTYFAQHTIKGQGPNRFYSKLQAMTTQSNASVPDATIPMENTVYTRMKMAYGHKKSCRLKCVLRF